MTARRKDLALIAGALFLLFAAATLFRPLLPIDETRYMTVAWEMHLNHNYILPTLNFQPYHHKPPVLFWLINLAWAVAGVSRAAGLIPIFAASALMIFLTERLSRALFPDDKEMTGKIPFIMLGSAPFLTYGTLVMFDVWMAVLVLSVFLLFLSHARDKKSLKIIAAGLLLGVSVLTKGPVAYLYVLPPLLLAPLWQKTSRAWYGAIAGAVAISALPVLAWLYPVVHETSSEFSFWLIWNQTAGRVTGNFSSSHARPVYFFLPLLPFLFAPWLFFPAFWKKAKTLKTLWPQSQGIRFIACWMIPVFIAFSLISGKQPHYLLPLLPGAAILAALLLEKIAVKKITLTAAAMVALACAGQAVASKTFLTSYDLAPISSYIMAHPEYEWAMIQKNQGETGFLARMKKPVATVSPKELPAWFAAHPQGRVIMRYKEGDSISRKYTLRFSQPYRGKSLGVFSAGPPHDTNNES